MGMMRSPIWRVFGYLKHFPKEMVLNVSFNVLHIFFNLFSFVLIVPFVELLFGMTQPPEVCPELSLNQSALTGWLMWHLCHYKVMYGVWKCMLIVSIGYIGCAFLSNLCRYLGFYFLCGIRAGIIQRMRDDIYDKITILPVGYFNARRRGDLLSRMSNDLFDIEWSVVQAMQSFIKDPINIIVFAATLVLISARLFLYFLLILPIAVLLIAWVGKSLKRNSNRGQERLGGLFSQIEEALSNIRVIKAFGREDDVDQKFSHSNQDYARVMMRVARRRELSSPMSEVLGTIGLSAILIIGGSLVIGGEMPASIFILFVVIFARLIPPIQSVVRAYNSIQKGSASARRFFEVMDADEKIVEVPNAKVLSSFNSNIEYKDVCFSYEDEASKEFVQVLDHVSVTIPKGKMYALVGPSGAGKTTMVDLLTRFYDLQSGQILIDGDSISEVNIDSLRALIGVVSQQCILFNDTVANNIAFGHPEYTREQIESAAKVAAADDFIKSLPHGYDTIIGDKGTTLSGGQRQRLSIARAVLKNPPILVLDEATSALDAESEHAVQGALQNLMKGRTSIVIAHRLSTIQNADCILVMNKGRIVEQGEHKKLILQDGLYKKLTEMQSFE